eukprot:8093936-Alexandrium_andersonii.AAC.1
MWQGMRTTAATVRTARREATCQATRRLRALWRPDDYYGGLRAGVQADGDHELPPGWTATWLSLIHISEPTRLALI